PVLLRKTEEPSRYNTLIRLFSMGLCVPADEAAKALNPMPLEPLVEMGLLRADSPGIRSIARLGVFENLYFLSDFTLREKSECVDREGVLSVNASSVTLANLTVRRRSETVLDLGTGCGIQSMLAAKHAARVTGTDVNPRALDFAEFNARLNGFQNLEWREGSYFEPVHGQQFDLVVSNPPYVISPESSLLYRDSGLRGDSVSQTIVQSAGTYLKESGYASLLLNWHHASDQDWHERPLEWVEDNGCDAWLIRFADEDPLSYAETWLAEVFNRDPRQYEERLRNWLKYYGELGIRRMAFGQLTLRKRKAEENWFRCDILPAIQGFCPCGDQVQRVFAAEDLMNSSSGDTELLSRRFAIAPDVVLDQRLAPRASGWAAEAMNLHFARGLPFSGNVDATLLRLITLCDGKSPLKDVIKCVCKDSGATGASAEHCLDLAKALIRWGMLT
ncbi:MAG TPA: class I SAM-dependent methyltransferase, partial [Clostridia bacterium]|nr:class I SAM-dependent methyltransferase [Clostridia bacterium]